MKEGFHLLKEANLYLQNETLLMILNSKAGLPYVLTSMANHYSTTISLVFSFRLCGSFRKDTLIYRFLSVMKLQKLCYTYKMKLELLIPQESFRWRYIKNIVSTTHSQNFLAAPKGYHTHELITKTAGLQTTSR
jgi:hypothetical protein